MSGPRAEDAFVVQAASGEVLAVFSDARGAQTYAEAQPGRRVTASPLMHGSPTTVAVHTRWVEVDADGSVRSDRDSYAWCPELDHRDGTPPAAEIEEYSDGPRRRLLCVGTDLPLLDLRLAEALRTVALNDDNVALAF